MQDTYLTVTITVKMTPAQRAAYEEENDLARDTGPEDVRDHLRDEIQNVILGGSQILQTQEFATFSVGQPQIDDLPRCTHRCRDGKHCGGCGCRGCGYEAAPQLPGLEDEQPVGSLADCTGCDTRLVKRSDGRWSPVLRVSTECPSGGGHIPQSVAA